MNARPLSINLSNARARILGEGAWVASGQMASALAVLAGTRLLTEYLPAEVYGTISLLLGLASLGTTIACGPFFQTALRFYPEAVKKGQAPYLRKIVNGFLFRAAGVLICVFAVLWVIFRQRISIVLLILLAGLLIVDVTRTRETNFLNADRRQRPYAAWLALDAWARPLAALVMVFAFGASAGPVMAGYFAGSLVVLLVFYKILDRNNIKDELKPENEPMKAEIFRYALPLIPLAVIGWVNSLSDRYLIGGLAGLGQVGIYAAAYGLVSRPFLMAGGIITQTLRPVYYEAVSSGDKTREKRTFFYFLAVTVVVCICGVAMVTLLRGAISGLLLAEKYRKGAELMPWIALGYALLAISFVFIEVFYAYKKTKYVLFLQIASAVVCLMVEIPAIYRYGILGAAVSVPVYFGAQLAMSIFLARRALRSGIAHGN